MNRYDENTPEEAKPAAAAFSCTGVSQPYFGWEQQILPLNVNKPGDGRPHIEPSRTLELGKYLNRSGSRERPENYDGASKEFSIFSEQTERIRMVSFTPLYATVQSDR